MQSRNEQIHVHHRMKLLMFTPGKPSINLQTPSQDWKAHTKLVINCDKLNAKTSKSDTETPSFGSDQNEAKLPSPRKTTMQRDPSINKTDETLFTLLGHCSQYLTQEVEINILTRNHIIITTNSRSKKYSLQYKAKLECRNES